MEIADTQRLTTPPRAPKRFVCLLCNKTFLTPNFSKNILLTAVYRKYTFLNHLDLDHLINDKVQAQNMYDSALRGSQAWDHYHSTERTRFMELRAVELMFTQMMRGFPSLIVTHMALLWSD